MEITNVTANGLPVEHIKVNGKVYTPGTDIERINLLGDIYEFEKERVYKKWDLAIGVPMLDNKNNQITNVGKWGDFGEYEKDLDAYAIVNSNQTIYLHWAMANINDVLAYINTYNYNESLPWSNTNDYFPQNRDVVLWANSGGIKYSGSTGIINGYIDKTYGKLTNPLSLSFLYAKTSDEFKELSPQLSLVKSGEKKAYIENYSLYVEQ